MQNLKKNWLVVWKITWGIWQIFTRALESWDSKLGLLWGTFIPSRRCMSLKFTGELCVMTKKKDAKFEKELTLMGCFWPKYIMLQLRKYREVMFDGTQDWLKMFEGKLICCFKNDKNLVNFDPSTQKSQKVLSGNLWPKEVIFHDTREWCKIWRKTNLWFGK